MNIIDKDLSYDFQQMQVSNDKASVKVTENYKFYFNDVKNGLSIAVTDYTINLVKQNKKWLIKDIKSNDYFDQAYSETDFDYDAKLKEMTAEPQPIIKEDADKIIASRAMALSSLSIIAYNPSAAINYADDYWGPNSTDYNSDFPDFSSSGGDCQNYASQCVSAGFDGRMQTSGTAQWYCTLSSWTSSWISCTPFADMVRVSNSSTPGLLGYVPLNNNLSYVKAGDVVQGPGSAGPYQHAAFVVQVTNPDGQQTPSSIYVNAHSNNRYHVTVQWMFGNDAVRHVAITGWVE